MEIWTSRVTFAHEQTGREKIIIVRGKFEDDYPVCNIVDELVEMAAEKLPHLGRDYEMLYSDEEQVS